MVTNCSKERPGSIVTKALKNRILISRVTSQESHCYADFKYVSFIIKFSLTHQKLRAWENLPYFRKWGNPPKSHLILKKVTPSDSAYHRTLLYKFQAPIYKNVEFCIFCQNTNPRCVFIYLILFSKGDCTDPVVLKFCERAHSNGNEKF